MARPLRLFHAGAGSYFIVDHERVYAGQGGTERIAKGEPYAGPHEKALLEAAAYFDDYYDVPFPGAPSRDPEITSGGRLNAREAARFRTDPGGVAARRSDLAGHLDFFDGFDGDGVISLSENYRSWRRLGFGVVKSLIQTAGSAVIFGRAADRFGIDIERIGAKRPRGSTGIYDSDGNVDQSRLAEFLTAFDERPPLGVLTHDELRAALAARAHLGTVPRRQFESLCLLTARLNRSATVTKEQFRGLFDNSLFWTTASIPDPTGRRALSERRRGPGRWVGSR